MAVVWLTESCTDTANMYVGSCLANMTRGEKNDTWCVHWFECVHLERRFDSNWVDRCGDVCVWGGGDVYKWLRSVTPASCCHPAQALGWLQSLNLWSGGAFWVVGLINAFCAKNPLAKCVMMMMRCRQCMREVGGWLSERLRSGGMAGSSPVGAVNSVCRLLHELYWGVDISSHMTCVGQVWQQPHTRMYPLCVLMSLFRRTFAAFWPSAPATYNIILEDVPPPPTHTHTTTHTQYPPPPPHTHTHTTTHTQYPPPHMYCAYAGCLQGHPPHLGRACRAGCTLTVHTHYQPHFFSCTGCLQRHSPHSG